MIFEGGRLTDDPGLTPDDGINVERLARMASVDGSWLDMPPRHPRSRDEVFWKRWGCVVLIAADAALWIALACVAALGAHLIGLI